MKLTEFQECFKMKMLIWNSTMKEHLINRNVTKSKNQHSLSSLNEFKFFCAISFRRAHSFQQMLKFSWSNFQTFLEKTGKKSSRPI